MTKSCVIRRCISKKSKEKRSFYCFPSVAKTVYIDRLNSDRRKRWISALKLSESFKWRDKYVCDLHFHSEKPARPTDTQNVNWVPSLELPGLFDDGDCDVLTSGSSDSDSDNSRLSHTRAKSLISRSEQVGTVSDDSKPMQNDSPSVPSGPSSSSSKRVLSTNSDDSFSSQSTDSDNFRRTQSLKCRSEFVGSLNDDSKSLQNDGASVSSGSRSSSSNRVLDSDSDDSLSSQSTDSDNSRRKKSPNSRSKLVGSFNDDSRLLQNDGASVSSGSSSSSSNRVLDSDSDDARSSQPTNSDNSHLSQDSHVNATSEPQVFTQNQNAVLLPEESQNSGLKPIVHREIQKNADDALKSDLVSNDEHSTLNTSVLSNEIGVQVGDRCYSSETFTQYYKEMIRLQQHCYKLNHQLSLASKGIEFLVDDAKCNYYTGIEKLSVFTKLYEFLKPSLDEPYCNFSQDQMLVMTLTKLRLNTQFTELAYDYGVCTNTISKYFHRTLYVIFQCCRWVIQPTPRENLSRHVPPAFQKMFGSRRVFIVDCFEVRCQTPSDVKASIMHFSNYKKHETVKFLIACHPDGSIAFVSVGFAGRCSDREIFIQSKFLDLIEEGDIILADKGFDIADIVKSKKASLNIPTFLRKKNQFTTKELEVDKQITSLRIHIERIIGLIRGKYKILSSTIPVQTLGRFQNGLNIVDLVVKVACILVSFNKSIIN